MNKRPSKTPCNIIQIISSNIIDLTHENFTALQMAFIKIIRCQRTDSELFQVSHLFTVKLASLNKPIANNFKCNKKYSMESPMDWYIGKRKFTEFTLNIFIQTIAVARIFACKTYRFLKYNLEEFKLLITILLRKRVALFQKILA